VKPADLFAQLFEAIGFDQNMVMVRQNTPGVNDARVIPADFQQIVFAFGHPLVAGANNVRVLVTGSGDEELLFAFKIPMRRRMPGSTLLSPMFYNLALLFGCELAVFDGLKRWLDSLLVIVIVQPCLSRGGYIFPEAVRRRCSEHRL
jgi:hypothetical protein